MNRQQRRARQRTSPLPPRPTLLSEQMLDQINANIGRGRRVMNRQECTEFMVMLAANLEHLLNAKEQLPHLATSIDKRANGFSLHVNVIDPVVRNDMEL